MSENTTVDPMIGRLLDGRYQIRSRIARGGMATVYQATDLRLERRVAVKVMHGHLADDAAFRERFIREARSAARLAHPNVVAVFDQGEDSDMAYLVMEYLPGITLRELLQEHRVLTTEQTLDVMEAVLSGLAAAHKAGIVHRDLKPENVLLADDGRIKIGDFGLARAVSANTATGAALLGTIAYLSPELVTRGVADARSDIYAVGIMMYEMLTGEQPYKGDQPVQIAYQHANESVPPPSAKNPRVPAELDELVLWATARKPEDRPKDARELLDHLFETHSSLMTALPDTGSDTGQRTTVLPGLGGRMNTGETTVFTPAAARVSTAETTVLGPRGRAATGPAPHVSDRTAALAIRSRRGKRRTWLWIVLVILAALLAAGAGWWFSVGPGAQVRIPDTLAGLTQEEARAELTELGLVVAPDVQSQHDPVIPVDHVVSTNPAPGELVLRGETVQLVVSLGPRSLPIPPEVWGMPEEDARRALEGFDVAEENIRQFDAAPVGTVLDVVGADGASFHGVAEALEGTPMTLVVSEGPLVDVTRLTVDVATARLAEQGVSVNAVTQAYSPDVPVDTVMAVNPLQQPLRVGGAVDLVVSLGPELFPIPDVRGMSVNDAIATIEAAGFVVEDVQLPAPFRESFAVTGTNPAQGEMHEQGTVVRFTGYEAMTGGGGGNN